MNRYRVIIQFDHCEAQFDVSAMDPRSAWLKVSEMFRRSVNPVYYEIHILYPDCDVIDVCVE